MLIEFKQVRMTRNGWKINETDINPEHVISLEEYIDDGVVPIHEVFGLDKHVELTRVTLVGGTTKIVFGSRTHIRQQLHRSNKLLHG